MTGNIRAALGEWPAVGMLVIVGASHKGYLNQMLNMRLADAEVVLK